MRGLNSVARNVCHCVVMLAMLAFAGVLQARAEEQPDAGTADAAAEHSEVTVSTPVSTSHRLQFLNAEVASRYVYQDVAAGQVAERDLAYRVTTTVRLNVISGGSTYFQMRGENGPAFDGGFQSTGVGSPGTFNLNVKSLFIGQRFGSYVEAQAGGIEYDRGAGSDITYAAGEAWLTGYRLSVNHFIPHGVRIIST
ncbi:MAG: hypothetical protein LAO56_20015 [Acidobacteriia bacterium]|nr:hypothetical protein [Terriglobia bacterium]